ncbi:hypothetical protein Vi05172_g3577 [Venturia inaequalis]|nr:hypothetical protein Vi05172_g3577 [Venturia inaequalis]
MSRIGPPATPEVLPSPQRPREAGPEDFTRDSRRPMGRMLISAAAAVDEDSRSTLRGVRGQR